MTPNVGNTDRIVRIALAVIITILYFMNIVSGTLGIVLLVVAGLLVVTSVINFCPLWALLKVNTRWK